MLKDIFDRLFRQTASLSAAERDRLDAWRQQVAPASTTEFASIRCVVVDLETTGLDLRGDQLIAIGAVAVKGGQIDLNDSFEIILQQPAASDKNNILIHGIGGTAQTEGVPPAETLLSFLEFLGKDPLVAFHASFDEIMLKRALWRFLNVNFAHPWLDLAYLMPGLYPQLAQKYRALDDWALHFRIPNYARHNALADAHATAQLFLIALGQAAQQGLHRFSDLQDMEKAQRWASRSNV